VVLYPIIIFTGGNYIKEIKISKYTEVLKKKKKKKKKTSFFFVHIIVTNYFLYSKKKNSLNV